jgi:Tfp pilus assembly protein FimT
MGARSAGVTLIELAIYLVIAAVLAVVAVQSYRGGEIKARYQAERLRSDLRHAQMIALSRSQPLRFTATAGTPGSYNVFSLASAGCATSALTDPATGGAFSVQLDSVITLTTSPATFDFDALGRPASCSGTPCTCAVSTGSDPVASYGVSGSGAAYTVAVKRYTGFVTVTP